MVKLAWLLYSIVIAYLLLMVHATRSFLVFGRLELIFS
jgi:hypothetical protein